VVGANLVVWAEVSERWGWVVSILNVLMFLVGLFLILLVLIQRGKGGGLAGAFGGAGGSSAFGSRAGDAFTRVTLIVAGLWLFLIMITIKMIQPTAPLKGRPELGPEQQQQAPQPQPPAQPQPGEQP
jgi:preprotein translocase subunit SecG